MTNFISRSTRSQKGWEPLLYRTWGLTTLHSQIWCYYEMRRLLFCQLRVKWCTFSSRTRSILFLPSGLISFRINAMMMSMPLDSWVAMQFCKNKHNRAHSIWEVCLWVIDYNCKIKGKKLKNLIVFVFVYLPGYHGRALDSILWDSLQSD